MGSLTYPHDEINSVEAAPRRLGVSNEQGGDDRARLLRQIASGLASRGIRSIALFGAGRHTRVILRQPWNDAGIEVRLILDDTPTRQTLGGIPIIRPTPGQPPEGIDAIVLSSEHYEDQLESRARELFPGTDLPIIRLYQPDAFRYEPETTRARLQHEFGLSDEDAQWLIVNRSERHDASVDMIAPERRTLHQRRYELARELLDEMAGTSVADLACGTGYAAEILTHANEVFYSGIDIDARAIEYANRRHGGDRRRFTCASATSTPLDHHSVDMIASFETIEHIEDTESLVAEYARVLNERGLLVVSTPNKLGLTEHHVHDFSTEDLVAAISSRFEVLSVIGQLATDTVFDPDLPPGMWRIDDDGTATKDNRRADYAIVVARLRDSNRPRLLTANAPDTVRVPTRHGTIPFFCPTETVRWRAQTLLTKEPETIAWIDAFQPGDVYWDIGASTGPYAMYAAFAGRISQVIALEPSPWNWWVLAEQIRRCGLGHIVRALPIAVSDRTSISDLHMRHPIPGGAGSSFEHPIGELGEVFDPQYAQPSIGVSIDELTIQLGLPVPNRIKIDVDGNELRVLQGAAVTLGQPQLRSVLVELESSRTDLVDEVKAMMMGSGLGFVARSAPGTDPGTVNSSICNYRFDRA